MISVGGDLSCENLWRYRLLCFWRSSPASLFDHSSVRMTIMIFQPRSSNITGIADSIVTTDPFPTSGLRASSPEVRGWLFMTPGRVPVAAPDERIVALDRRLRLDGSRLQASPEGIMGISFAFIEYLSDEGLPFR
jgi:hypothetical protein